MLNDQVAIEMYQRTWRRGIFQSFFSYIRDIIIFILPVRCLNPFLVCCFYRISPDFIFFVHIRRAEDIFIFFPFLKFLKNFISEERIVKFLEKYPPTTLERVFNSKAKALVICSLVLPDVLLKERKKAIYESQRCLRLFNKICKNGAFVGLGAWWPMLTRRGMSIKDYAESLGLCITTGHCGTLVSIYLMIKKIIDLGEISLSDTNVAIIGVGKMGETVAYSLSDRVKKITLIDIDERCLIRKTELLREKAKITKIESFLRVKNMDSIKDVLDLHHLAVCTTSNIEGILNPKDIPDNFIIIDDSRPEAIPRETMDDSKIVIEGGLMKIKDISSEYDYGFGIDENQFGCLVEPYLLTIDISRQLLPTIGKVNELNFKNVLDFCKVNQVSVGDFKTGRRIIPDNQVEKVIKQRIKGFRDNIKVV